MCLKKRKICFLGSVHTWCPFYSTPGTNVNTPFFTWHPRQNSGTVPVPEYKVLTLYSGTKLGTESLCEHIFRWCPGTLPTNHLFSYPQFLVPLEISIVSVCSVYWMWTYLQTGYRVSEHSTILCRCLGTSARAPSVNTALEVEAVPLGNKIWNSGECESWIDIKYGQF